MRRTGRRRWGASTLSGALRWSPMETRWMAQRPRMWSARWIWPEGASGTRFSGVKDDGRTSDGSKSCVAPKIRISRGCGRSKTGFNASHDQVLVVRTMMGAPILIEPRWLWEAHSGHATEQRTVLHGVGKRRWDTTRYVTLSQWDCRLTPPCFLSSKRRRPSSALPPWHLVAFSLSKGNVD